MTRIRDVVQKALASGYLTVEAENQLRHLLTTRYDIEDFNAFMTLQEAAMNGNVRQQSREKLSELSPILLQGELNLFIKVTRFKETADHHLSINHPEKAKFYYKKVIGCLEIFQEDQDLKTRRSVMNLYLEIYQRIVAICIYTDDSANALLYTELSKNRYLVERLAKQDTPLPETFPLELSQQIEKTKLIERRTLAEYTYYEYEISGNQNKQIIAESSKKWSEAKQLLANLYSQVSEIEPEFIAKTKVYPISFTNIQSLIPPDTAIIEFFFAQKVLVLMLIIPGTEKPIISEDLCLELKDNSLEDIARNWISSFTAKPKVKKELEIDKSIQEIPFFLDKISDYLNFRKLLDYIPYNIQSLIVVPNNYLHLFPIHALKLNEHQHLADRFSVQYFPSIQVWIICQKRQRKRQSLLAIENPTQDRDLIFSQAEVTSISQRQHFIQNRVLSGQLASKPEILLLATRYHCFHFSGHAEYNFDNPLDSYLMLSPNSDDEDLTLNTIFTDLHMPHTDLVTLSACCTGMVDAFQPTEEYLGLPTGFLLAGAKAVVSSLWKVNSIATAFLLDEFYRQLDQIDNKAVALQKAQIWLRCCTADTLRERTKTWDLSKLEPKELFRLQRALKRLEGIPFENPYYWAAFVLTGC